MRFVWDPAKNRTNFTKHGVWFEEAQTVWADPLAEEFLDDDHSTDEQRFLRVGRSRRHRTLLVVFVERVENQLVRIISARPATRHERAQYEEGI